MKKIIVKKKKIHGFAASEIKSIFVVFTKKLMKFIVKKLFEETAFSTISQKKPHIPVKDYMLRSFYRVRNIGGGDRKKKQKNTALLQRRSI